MSEGEGTSAGYREARDIWHVVDYLVDQAGFKEVILWGRSMGAVAALMYSSQAH